MPPHPFLSGKSLSCWLSTTPPRKLWNWPEPIPRRSPIADLHPGAQPGFQKLLGGKANGAGVRGTGWVHRPRGGGPGPFRAVGQGTVRAEDRFRLRGWSAQGSVIEMGFAATPFAPIRSVKVPDSLAGISRLIWSR